MCRRRRAVGASVVAASPQVPSGRCHAEFEARDGDDEAVRRGRGCASVPGRGDGRGVGDSHAWRRRRPATGSRPAAHRRRPAETPATNARRPRSVVQVVADRRRRVVGHRRSQHAVVVRGRPPSRARVRRRPDRTRSAATRGSRRRRTPCSRLTRGPVIAVGEPRQRLRVGAAPCAPSTSRCERSADASTRSTRVRRRRSARRRPPAPAGRDQRSVPGAADAGRTGGVRRRRRRGGRRSSCRRLTRRARRRTVSAHASGLHRADACASAVGHRTSGARRRSSAPPSPPADGTTRA